MFKLWRLYYADTLHNNDSDSEVESKYQIFYIYIHKRDKIIIFHDFVLF